jgi:hypothetical protein
MRAKADSLPHVNVRAQQGGAGLDLGLSGGGIDQRLKDSFCREQK